MSGGRRARLGDLARGTQAQSGKLLSQLAGGRSCQATAPRSLRRPYMRHCEDAGGHVEVSWALEEHPEKTERRAAEARLIRLHREVVGVDPPIQRSGRATVRDITGQPDDTPGMVIMGYICPNCGERLPEDTSCPCTMGPDDKDEEEEAGRLIRGPLTAEIADVGSPVRQFLSDRFTSGLRALQRRYREDALPLAVPGRAAGGGQPRDAEDGGRLAVPAVPPAVPEAGRCRRCLVRAAQRRPVGHTRRAREGAGYWHARRAQEDRRITRPGRCYRPIYLAADR